MEPYTPGRSVRTALPACYAATLPVGSLTMWDTKPPGRSQTGPCLPLPSATYLGEFALPILSVLSIWRPWFSKGSASTNRRLITSPTKLEATNAVQSLRAPPANRLVEKKRINILGVNRNFEVGKNMFHTQKTTGVSPGSPLFSFNDKWTSLIATV